ncbi:MAG: hypothetical protein ACR2NA_00430 [Solirubrobacterales bacterium]
MSRERHPEIETLLSRTLRPVDPPERLSTRVERTLTIITEAAAMEISDWERDAMSDPRSWVRPVVAATVGGAAATGLVLMQMRRRRQPGAFERIGSGLTSRLGR